MKDSYIAIAVILIVSLSIGGGFLADPDHLKINRIETESTFNVLANYSDRECGFDWEGDYDCWTNYWTEEVTETNFVNTIYDEEGFRITDYYQPDLKEDQVVATKPKEKLNHPATDFDSYSDNYHMSIKVYLDLDDKHEDYVTIELPEYKNATASIGNIVVVEKWYGFRRSIVIPKND
jgi:hypothetical protein